MSGTDQAVARWEAVAGAGVEVPSGRIWAQVGKCESRRVARVATWKSRSVAGSSGIFAGCVRALLTEDFCSLFSVLLQY